MNFLTLYEELNTIQEAKNSKPFTQGYVEAAEPINLSSCRTISSDVRDIRGEFEESACLEYKGVLTRVAASVLPFRDGPEGKEVFLKLWRSAVYLLGGGVDLHRDGTDPMRTVVREAFEEANMTLTNIKDSGCSYWEYSEKSWVERHVTNPEDRWSGYYTWLFTADYNGKGNNEFPEEEGNFRWHKVSDILARPDTKKLKFIKQAIIQGGYADTLREDMTLTESKQLGYVSYAIRKSTDSPAHPLNSLAKILSSGYIKASVEEDGSRYVSLSRDLLGHLTAGSTWKCGLVLDGDRLADKYKVKPVNYNSLVYFSDGASAKQLMLRSIAKYQALDNNKQVTDRTFYIANMQGSSFLTEITQTTYEVLKTLMEAHNNQLAVQDLGKAAAKYKGKTNQEVKSYFNIAHTGLLPQNPKSNAWKQFLDTTDQDIPQWLRDKEQKPPTISVGSIMQKERVPRKYADATWLCTESIGYNSPLSDLVLKAPKLNPYRELIISKHGIDITTSEFFKQISGQYSDEAEERAEAQLIKLVDTYGIPVKEETVDTYGINISRCVKAILIDNKHREAFKDVSEDTLKSNKPLYLYDGEIKTTRLDQTPGLREAALYIRQFADQNNIPIILFIPGKTTNSEVLRQIN